MPHVPDTVPGKRVTDAGARTEGRGQPSNIRGGSRMQESCTYGSVRGAPSNGRPYRHLEVLTVGIVPCRLRGPCYASLPKTKFAADSALEGTGFEPSVPRQEKWSMPSSSDQTRVGRTLTLGGGAESSLEGRDIELSVSPERHPYFAL